MGERKGVMKYYPPGFDPAKIPRRKQPKNQQMNVRMMIPMSIRCNTCGNYIYKGTKFNSRKEDALGEAYLGIQIFRFYFKCTRCSAEITMKTDPQNSDYEVESGASRNFEPWRADDQVADEKKQKREAEEMGNTMKSLENRTLDSKREMEIIAALDEMKSLKSRHAKVTVDAMLKELNRSVLKEEDKLVEEDEALIKSIFQGSREFGIHDGEFVKRIHDGEFVKRIHDEDFDDEEESTEFSSNISSKRRKVSKEFSGNPTDHLTKTRIRDSPKNKENDPRDSVGPAAGKLIVNKSTSVRFSVINKLPAASNGNSKPAQEEKTNIASNGVQLLCQHYDTDEDD